MTRGHLQPVERIVCLFKAFGIDIMERWRLCKTPEEQVEAFEAARAEAKIYHRRLAMELHPDRGGDEEQLKEVNAVWTQLQKIKMTVRSKSERKSAVNVGEARGYRQTSVFVGVTTNPATAADNPMTGDWPTVNWSTASSNPGLTQEDFVRMMNEIMKPGIF